MTTTFVMAPARGPGRPKKDAALEGGGYAEPAQEPVEVAEPAPAPAPPAGPRFVEVQVLRKIGLEYVPDEDGVMQRVTSEKAITAHPGEVVKVTTDAANKFLRVQAVTTTAHTF
jgi:hypothetical protein